MKLYYCDRERGTETFIAEAQEDKEIWRAMERWLTEHGFGLIYVIHHIEKQKIYYEFGKEHCLDRKSVV